MLRRTPTLSFAQRIAALALLWLLLPGCGAGAAPAMPPTATALRVVQPASPAQTERTLQPVAAPTTSASIPPATAAVAQPPCPPGAVSPVASHQISIRLDYARRAADASQIAQYHNRSNQPLNGLVLNIEANRLPGAFTLHTLTVDGAAPPAYELEGRRLLVTLPQPLAPGCAAVLRLEYTLLPPRIGQDVPAAAGYFGYSTRQTNFGNALPFFAGRLDGEWISHPSAALGEQFIGDPADWDVTIALQQAPGSVQIDGPGAVAELPGGARRFTLAAAREFSFSLNDGAARTSVTTPSGVQIEMVSYADDARQSPSGPQDALQAAADALDIFSDLFGPYPFPRLVVIEGDFPDGMEHTGLVFVSGDWFRSYRGTPQSYLVLITVHEVAHQWWYGRVGSDQALTPFLDEALATYSELIYLEERHPELRQWWWDFRVSTFVPPDATPGPAGADVYHFENVRSYINAVYLNGARMLQTLRDQLGTEAFFAWLRRYADAGAGRIVTLDTLWGMLSPAERDAAAQTIARYMQR